MLVFFLFFNENMLGVQWKRQAKTLLMSTHHTNFHGEIRKNYLDISLI